MLKRPTKRGPPKSKLLHFHTIIFNFSAGQFVCFGQWRNFEVATEPTGVFFGVPTSAICLAQSNSQQNTAHFEPTPQEPAATET